MSARPGFVAFIHDDAAGPAVDAAMAALGLSGARRLEIEDGWLALWPGNDSGDALLAVVDGTGGAPEVAVPQAIADMSGVPARLRGRIAQHRSYLWRDGGGIGVWTDHTGLSRLYAARFEGCLAVSDRTAPLARLAPGIDDGMVASFLANRWMLLDRTLDTSVRSIPVASAGTLTPDGASTRPYWRFRPGAEPMVDDRALEGEFWRRVRAAVLAHAGGRPVLLPLSGGYDSSTLLGVLRAEALPVSAFSFSEGEPRPGSDADVARLQARALGVPHHLYRMDGVDTVGMLEANLANGLDRRSLCYELSVYRRAAADAPGGAIFMFGEQAFGMGAYRLFSDTDLLGAGAMRNPDVLDGCADALGAGRVQGLRQALSAVYAEVLSSIPVLPDRDDVKDWLYFTNLFPSDTGPLRVHTAAPWLPFAQPFLDLSLMDFVRHMAAGHRLHKRLFRQAAARRLPDVFGIPRAIHTQAAPDLPAALRRDEAAIGRLLGSLGPEIPGLGPAAGLAYLLRDALTEADTPAPLRVREAARAALGDAYRTLLQRRLVPRPVMLALRRRLFNRYEWRPSRATLFLRAVQVAIILDRRPEPVSCGLRPAGAQGVGRAIPSSPEAA